MTSARVLGLEVAGMSGGEELVLCPFHEDRKPSAWYSPTKDLFYCAVCNLGLNLYQLADRLNLDVSELEEFAPDDLPDLDLIETPIDFELGERVYIPYYEQRNISEYVTTLYGLTWQAKPEAVILPLTNLNGKLKGVQYRYLHPEETGTRYRTVGETFPVWPMHFLKATGWVGEPLLVTEGAWSAMRLTDYAARQGHSLLVLALLGAKANQRIVDTLRPFNCCFLYDGDKAGKRACAKMRSLWPTAHVWTLSVSPDDMSDEQIEALFNRLDSKGVQLYA
jgi:hypothetical protein